MSPWTARAPCWRSMINLPATRSISRRSAQNLRIPQYSSGRRPSFHGSRDAPFNPPLCFLLSPDSQVYSQGLLRWGRSLRQRALCKRSPCNHAYRIFKQASGDGVSGAVLSILDDPPPRRAGTVLPGGACASMAGIACRDTPVCSLKPFARRPILHRKTIPAKRSGRTAPKSRAAPPLAMDGIGGVVMEKRERTNQAACPYSFPNTTA